MFIPATDAMVSLGVDLPEPEVTTGSTVTGTALIEAGVDVDVRGCEVALIRSTSYLYRQGNLYGGATSVPARSTEVVAARGLTCAGPLGAGRVLTLPFTLAVPADGPGTIAASLIQINWAVRVRTQVTGSPPKEFTRPFVVLSRASEREAAADAPPAADDRGLVALSFSALSSRHLLPGAAIIGTLNAAPRRPGSTRAVRVELLLREQVHRGPWIGTDPARNPADQARETDTVVARQVLAQNIQLDPSQPLALAFMLQAPARLASPSLSTEPFSLSWILRGVADRPLRPDPFVEIELHGATASP